PLRDRDRRRRPRCHPETTAPRRQPPRRGRRGDDRDRRAVCERRLHARRARRARQARLFPARIVRAREAGERLRRPSGALGTRHSFPRRRGVRSTLRVRITASVSIIVSVVVLAGAPARAALQVHPGIGFIAVTDAAPGAEVVLQDRRHVDVGRGTTDRFGSFIFHDLRQGGRYVVSDGADVMPVTVPRFRDHPDQSFYRRQTLTDGFHYIEARDGTLLAAMVRAPLGKQLADGPFPTVVEYSGYAAADPESPQPVTQIAGALGFATVAVNMRGSGCSGGVIDLFDWPTTADGYDVVETVAAQPWVKGGKVGLIGISFSGISQLFVGGARPPHLLAMAPLSGIADIYRSPGFPG